MKSKQVKEIHFQDLPRDCIPGASEYAADGVLVVDRVSQTNRAAVGMAAAEREDEGLGLVYVEEMSVMIVMFKLYFIIVR